jgi:hypothetical protein
MSRPRTVERQAAREEHTVTLPLDGFAWDALDEEAAREGLTVEQVIGFAVLYYLADHDSGRIARRISASPIGADPHVRTGRRSPE